MNNVEETLENTARMLCIEVKSDGINHSWYFHDLLHRDFDKPAMFWDDGSVEYWQYGKQIK